MLYNEAFLSIENLMEYLNMYELDHICAETTLYLGRNDLKEMINTPISNHYTENMEQALFKNVVSDIKEHHKEYYSLYQQLSDLDSQNTLFELIKFRLAPLSSFLSDIYSFKMAYLDNNILQLKKEGVVIDYGDSPDVYVNYFQSIYPDYKELIIYSRDKNICDICRNNLTEIPHLKIVCAGLGSKAVHLKLPNPINPKVMDELTVDVLDDAVKDSLSFLRINANGQEQDVLLGAKQHIKNNKPAIAICVGNTVSALWKIPKLLSAISSDYHFHLKHYSMSSICDTVLYAIAD